MSKKNAFFAFLIISFHLSFHCEYRMDIEGRRIISDHPIDEIITLQCAPNIHLQIQDHQFLIFYIFRHAFRLNMVYMYIIKSFYIDSDN